MFQDKKSSEEDHTSEEILAGRAIPKNKAEEIAESDYLSMQVVSGEDPIPKERPSWAGYLPVVKE